MKRFSALKKAREITGNKREIITASDKIQPSFRLISMALGCVYRIRLERKFSSLQQEEENGEFTDIHSSGVLLLYMMDTCFTLTSLVHMKEYISPIMLGHE